MQKYEIIEVIGEGAYGIVLKCRHNQRNELVAIKKIKEPEIELTEVTNKIILREIQILKTLNHENIVQLKQVFRKRQNIYLVFEYVNNNLLQVLQKYPSGLDAELIRQIIFQLLKGLEHIHSLNIAHRDIKPENILIDLKNQLKICDFGFAMTMNNSQSGGKLTEYVATRWYRSPELLTGTSYAKEVDLWAVGCIFAEIIDGNPIFPGEDQIDQLFLIQKCLGSLTYTQQKALTSSNKQRIILNIPHDKLQTIYLKYGGKITRSASHLLKQLLKINPTERITASDALKHPFFDGLREDYLSKNNKINIFHKQSSRTENNQLINQANKLNKKEIYQQKTKNPQPSKQMMASLKNGPQRTERITDFMSKSIQMFQKTNQNEQNKQFHDQKGIFQIYRIRNYSKPNVHQIAKKPRERIHFNLKNPLKSEMLEKSSSKSRNMMYSNLRTINQTSSNPRKMLEERQLLKLKQFSAIKNSYPRQHKNLTEILNQRESKQKVYPIQRSRILLADLHEQNAKKELPLKKKMQYK